MNYFECRKEGGIYHGTLSELAEQFDVSKLTLNRWNKNENVDFELILIGEKLDVYVFYKDDVPVANGTLEQIGEKMGMEPELVKFYSYPSVRERAPRLQAIKVEGEYMISRNNIIQEKPKPMNHQNEKDMMVIGGEVRDAVPKLSKYGMILFRGVFKNW